MTPQRRAWLLKRAAVQGEETVSGQRLDGGEQVACYHCGKAIRLLAQVVSVQNSSRTRQYHYRCYRWGGATKRPQVSTTNKAEREAAKVKAAEHAERQAPAQKKDKKPGAPRAAVPVATAPPAGGAGA